MDVYGITPILPVHDIDAAVAFAEAALGFELVARAPGHAHLRRGGAAIRFIGARPDADLNDRARQIAICIDVDDVDQYHAQHREALDALPPGLFRAPFDQPYGMREMHVILGPVQFSINHPIR